MLKVVCLELEVWLRKWDFCFLFKVKTLKTVEYIYKKKSVQFSQEWGWGFEGVNREWNVNSHRAIVCCLLNQLMAYSVYVWDGARQYHVMPHWDRSCRSNKFAISLSRSILTECQPVLALTLHCQASGRVATRVLSCKWLVWQDHGFVCLFVDCFTSQQHASVSQGRICSDSFTCCHTEIEVADPTLHLTQSQYTDTGPTSPSTDPLTPGAWQGSHWSANF